MNEFNYQITKLSNDRISCTGTRIRTQIKGFGDPYANRCTMPAYKYKISYLVFSIKNKVLRSKSKYFVKI